MADSPLQKSVLSAYAGHPLSKDSIVARIVRANGSLADVAELDLAVDSAGEITDQNHIGGALSTLRLAGLAAIRKSDRVLDLGCGLGGPARLLSAVFGCSVHGVDINEARIEDATRLTSMVKEQLRVSFSAQDILTYSPMPTYSVVWGQNSWIHVDHPREIIAVAARALSRDGRVAFEDVCLLREPHSFVERKQLGELCESWRCHLQAVSKWVGDFERAGLRTTLQEQETGLFAPYLHKMAAISARAPEVWPDIEIEGYQRACTLAEAGVIGYFRIVAVAT